MARVVASAVVGVLLVSLVAACTSDGAARAGSSAGPGLDVPTDPYPQFLYVSDAQRSSFKSFLECARRLGVAMDGPFADSNGHGALMRIAPGADEPSASARARVARRCPEGVVAIALTPDSMVRGKAFERALLRFGRCLNAHGAEQVPAPRFGSAASPWKGLVWPLNWNNRQLVHAAQKCVGPLRDFTLAG